MAVSSGIDPRMRFRPCFGRQSFPFTAMVVAGRDCFGLCPHATTRWLIVVCSTSGLLTGRLLPSLSSDLLSGGWVVFLFSHPVPPLPSCLTRRCSEPEDRLRCHGCASLFTSTISSLHVPHPVADLLVVRPQTRPLPPPSLKRPFCRSFSRVKLGNINKGMRSLRSRAFSS